MSDEAGVKLALGNWVQLLLDAPNATMVDCLWKWFARADPSQLSIKMARIRETGRHIDTLRADMVDKFHLNIIDAEDIISAIRDVDVALPLLGPQPAPVPTPLPAPAPAPLQPEQPAVSYMLQALEHAIGARHPERRTALTGVKTEKGNDACDADASDTDACDNDDDDDEDMNVEVADETATLSKTLDECISTDLYSHQLELVRYAKKRETTGDDAQIKGGIIGDEMGLGKTL
jgi:SNF2 family DNA or RNA helicase